MDTPVTAAPVGTTIAIASAAPATMTRRQDASKVEVLFPGTLDDGGDGS
jgi:hypothetical protein